MLIADWLNQHHMIKHRINEFWKNHKQGNCQRNWTAFEYLFTLRHILPCFDGSDHSCHHIQPGVSFAAFLSKSMTPLTLFGSYPTSRQPLIRCRRLFWSTSSLGCTVLHRTVQSLADHRPLSVWVKGSVHHTDRQENRPGYHWRQFISSNFELVSCIKTTGAHRCSPTDGLFIICRHLLPTLFVAVLSGHSLRCQPFRACDSSFTWLTYGASSATYYYNHVTEEGQRRLLAPFLAEPFNQSLALGVVLSIQVGLHHTNGE